MFLDENNSKEMALLKIWKSCVMEMKMFLYRKDN